MSKSVNAGNEKKICKTCLFEKRCRSFGMLDDGEYESVCTLCKDKGRTKRVMKRRFTGSEGLSIYEIRAVNDSRGPTPWFEQYDTINRVNTSC